MCGSAPSVHHLRVTASWACPLAVPVRRLLVEYFGRPFATRWSFVRQMTAAWALAAEMFFTGASAYLDSMVAQVGAGSQAARPPRPTTASTPTRVRATQLVVRLIVPLPTLSAPRRRWYPGLATRVRWPRRR